MYKFGLCVTLESQITIVGCNKIDHWCRKTPTVRLPKSPTIKCIKSRFNLDDGTIIVIYFKEKASFDLSNFKPKIIPLVTKSCQKLDR